jgi:hypothetical protein
MTQLAGGETLSPDILTQGASTAFAHGLRNTAQIIKRHTTQRFCSPPANDEFVGMADYIEEAIHDLLANDWSQSLIPPPARGSTTPRVNASWRTSSMTLTMRRPSKDMS